MPADPEIHAHLRRILASDVFATSARSAQFLRFCVERAQTGRVSELKETTIGVEVFQRPADYDPKTDSIVRVHARRVREKLAMYYRSAGSNDSIRINLPKGSYVPQIFHVAAPPGAEIDAEPVKPPPLIISTETLRPQRNINTRMLIGCAVLAIAAVGFASAWTWRGTLAPSSAPSAELMARNVDEENLDDPSWSPDGRKLAYTAPEMPEGERHLYVKDAVDGAGAVRVANEESIKGRPVWSPDGADLAFLREVDARHVEVERLHLADGTIKTLGDFPDWPGPENRPMLDWSPDGRHLLTAERDGLQTPRRLVLISAATGEHTLLTSPPADSNGDMDARFSPDGKWVAFRRGNGGDFYCISADDRSPGKLVRLTFDAEELQE